MQWYIYIIAYDKNPKRMKMSNLLDSLYKFSSMISNKNEDNTSLNITNEEQI